MRHGDTLQRFIFEDADIRGEIAHLDTSYNAILNLHDYPEPVKKYLGEVLLAAVLMSAVIKYEGQMTIQFKGNQSLPLLLVKCNHQYQVRALAKFDNKASNEILSHALNGGTLVVTIEPDNAVKPYQSIVPIIDNSIKSSLEHYFAQSEQLSTKFCFATSHTQASGMLLQLLPKQSKSQQREEFWSYASHIGDTLSDKELLELDNVTILHRLYHEKTLRLFNSEDVQFHCPCSKERMQRAIITLGKKEAMEIIDEQSEINVSCEFCLENYLFDSVDVTALFH